MKTFKLMLLKQAVNYKTQKLQHFWWKNHVFVFK